MDRLIIIIIAAVLIFTVLTYILHRVTSRQRYIKYLLPLIVLVFALYNYYQSRLPSEGFEDLGSFLLAFILFICFLSSLASSLFLDFIYPKIKNK